MLGPLFSQIPVELNQLETGKYYAYRLLRRNPEGHIIGQRFITAIFGSINYLENNNVEIVCGTEWFAPSITAQINDIEAYPLIVEMNKNYTFHLNLLNDRFDIYKGRIIQIAPEGQVTILNANATAFNYNAMPRRHNHITVFYNKILHVMPYYPYEEKLTAPMLISLGNDQNAKEAMLEAIEKTKEFSGGLRRSRGKSRSSGRKRTHNRRQRRQK